MKNLYRILIALLAFSFIAVSCKNQEFEYIPGDPETSGCYGVYFPTQDASGSHTYDPTMERSVTITVSRTNSTGAITVPYVATSSEDGIFNFGTINFADGQTETELLVTFPNAKVGVDYSFSVQIDDKQYASLYNEGAIALDFSVLIVEMKTLKDEKGNPTKVKFYVNNDFLGDFGISDPYELEGTIEYYEVNGVRYGTVVPDQGGIWLSDAVIKFIWYPNQEIEYDGKTYQLVEVPVGNTGYELPGSEVGTDHPCAVLFADYYHHYSDIKGNDLGTYLEFAAKYGQSYKLSYYDGHGGFYFNLVYDIEGTNYWYGFCEGTVVGIANGYTRVDYTFNLGTDYTVDGVAPVYVKTGVDIAKIKYAAFEGELTATQIGYKVADLTSGAETGEEYSGMVLDEEDGYKYGAFGVSPATSGTYTLVAIAFDEKGAVKNSASVVLNYIAAGDMEANAVDIHLATEPTPERYIISGGLDHYHSFSFFVYGKDVTEAHVGVFATKNFSADPEAYYSYVKSNTTSDGEDAGLGLSADDLAKLNAAGGFFDVVSGLKDGVSYTVIVWATNGALDKILTAEWTTDKIPEVYNSLGMCTYTDDFLTGAFNIQNLTYEVEIQESAENKGKYKLIYPYDGKFGYNEPGDWDDTESYDIIVDATNPDRVFITPQEIGVNWGYGMMQIASLAGYYLAAGYPAETIIANGFQFGTLKDGVITFPESGCVYNYGAKWVTANKNGATKIVLPSASSASVPASKAIGRSGVKFSSKYTVAKLEKPVYERDPQSVKVSVSEINNRENTYVRPSVHKSEKFSVK